MFDKISNGFLLNISKGAGFACVISASVMSNAVCAQSIAADDSGEVQIQEIIVTAQKRSENLQDVPIAINAITGQALAAMGVSDTAALPAAVPGMQITSQLGENEITIRGVGTSAIATEQAVATYIDGVYLPSQGAALSLLNNVERVEVLKGPQGTLFGRNSTGGVIQIVTRDPSHTPTLDTSLSYGNYGTVNTSLYAATGITDSLAADVALTYLDQANGWGHDLTTGESIFRQNSYAVRTKWVWSPSDDTKVTFAFDNSRIRGDMGLGFHVVPGSVGLDGVSKYNGYYNSAGNFNELFVDKQTGVMLRAEQQLASVRLTSLTSYRDAPSVSNFDQDATPLPVVNAGPLKTRDHTFSEELQAASTAEGPLKWIGGLYFFRDRTGASPFTIGGLAAAPLPYLQIFSNLPTDSYAAFSQGTFTLPADTALTVGLRYTRDDKSISGTTVLPGVADIDSGRQSARFDKLTWRFALDHHFTPDILGYVSYNRGFKSGVFEIINITEPPAHPEVLDAFEVGAKTELFDHRLRVNSAAYYYNYKNIQIEEEVIGTTELLNAAKAEIFGLDLDFTALLTRNWLFNGAMAYIHGKYTNFPNAPAYYPSASVPPAGVACAPAAFPGGNKSCTIADGSGLETVKSPHFTGTLSTDYKIPLDGSSVTLTASNSFNSGFFWNVDQRIRQPAFDLFNLSAGWETNSRSFGIKVWTNNLFNRQYAVVAYADALGDLASPGAPRTYGVTVSSHF